MGLKMQFVFVFFLHPLTSDMWIVDGTVYIQVIVKSPLKEHVWKT